MCEDKSPPIATAEDFGLEDSPSGERTDSTFRCTDDEDDADSGTTATSTTVETTREVILEVNVDRPLPR